MSFGINPSYLKLALSYNYQYNDFIQNQTTPQKLSTIYLKQRQHCIKMFSCKITLKIEKTQAYQLAVIYWGSSLIPMQLQIMSDTSVKFLHT